MNGVKLFRLKLQLVRRADAGRRVVSFHVVIARRAAQQ
jgi:hypothetical protein